MVVQPESSAFERATAVEPLGDGRYGADVGDEWNGPIAPNGGILAALCVRAAAAELGEPAPPPRMIAANFLEAAPVGPAEVAVEILRRGKRVAAADSRLRQNGKLICQASVVFSASREQDVELRAPAPTVPPPQEVAPIPGSILVGLPPVFHRLEVRPLFGQPPGARGEGEPLAGGWVSMRDDEAPLDVPRICALTDLWWPAIFGRMRDLVPVPTLQLAVHVRSVDVEARPPVLARFEARNVIEGHVEELGQLWSRDGTLLAESRQLALLPAVMQQR